MIDCEISFFIFYFSYFYESMAFFPFRLGRSDEVREDILSDTN